VIEQFSSTFDLFGGPLVEVGQVVWGGLKCKDGRGLDVLQIDFAAGRKKNNYRFRKVKKLGMVITLKKGNNDNNKGRIYLLLHYGTSKSDVRLKEKNGLITLS
jgi:hypothetical protein